MVKFLIIRFSSIGDIVLTTPVIRIIKTQINNSEIHYLTKKENSLILEGNNYIDKLHLYNKDTYNNIIEELIDEQFDFIIDLHKNLRTHKLKSKLKVPDFSFNKLNYKKWLLVNFKINKLPNIHIVDRYLETVSVFDIFNDNKGLDYFIPEKDVLKIDGITQSEKFVAIVIGAKHFTKRMPNEKLIQLINKIEQKIVLLGGKEDVENAKIIQDSVKKEVYNFCGVISLNQSASIIQQSSIVITHDTGLMHIASAFKKIVISIWGNTVPEFGMYPYLPNEKSKIFQVENLKCRPCSKIGFKNCPKKHFKCMKQINIDEISNYINKICISLITNNLSSINNLILRKPKGH